MAGWAGSEDVGEHWKCEAGLQKSGVLLSITHVMEHFQALLDLMDLGLQHLLADGWRTYGAAEKAKTILPDGDIRR